MLRLDVRIPALDGHGNETLHLPARDGQWLGVLVFPDAGGPQETFWQMGDRLASMDYVALIPDIVARSRVRSSNSSSSPMSGGCQNGGSSDDPPPNPEASEAQGSSAAGAAGRPQKPPPDPPWEQPDRAARVTLPEALRMDGPTSFTPTSKTALGAVLGLVTALAEVAVDDDPGAFWRLM